MKEYSTEKFGTYFMNNGFISNFENIFFIILIGLMVILVFFVIFIIVAGKRISAKHEYKYKIALISLLVNRKSDDKTGFIRSIWNEYSTYKDSSIIFTYKKVNVLNSVLVSELRNKEYEKFTDKIENPEEIADLLEEINNLIESVEYAETEIDEKLRKIFGECGGTYDFSSAQNSILLEISLLKRFYEGRCFELKNEISELKRTNENITRIKKRSNGFGCIGIIIGIIGLILTIIQIISK